MPEENKPAYKMKGSPMYRNFGIGTPLKAAKEQEGSLAGFKQYIDIKKYKPTEHVSISDKISKNLSKLFGKSKKSSSDKKVANTITEKVKETTERVTGKPSKKKETKT